MGRVGAALGVGAGLGASAALAVSAVGGVGGALVAGVCAGVAVVGARGGGWMAASVESAPVVGTGAGGGVGFGVAGPGGPRRRVGRRAVGTLIGVDEDVPRGAEEGVLEGFGAGAFQGWVGRSADVEVVAVSVPELAAEGRAAFLKALGDAARRGASVWVALLCPESDAALRMADALRESQPGFLAGLEEVLWVLYRWQREVNAAMGGERPTRPVEIVLYSQPFGRPPLPALAPHYVFDDTLVTVPLPTDVGEARVYARYPVDHRFALPFGMYRELIRTRHVPLEKHILDRVVVGMDGGPDLAGVKFVRHDGVKYLAVRDREAVTRLGGAARVEVFHGVGERVAYRPVAVGGGREAELVKVLDSLVAAKYGGAPRDERCFFYRLEGYEL
ncbi:hypothetical protein [Catenulispora yoronensis]